MAYSLVKGDTAHALILENKELVAQRHKEIQGDVQLANTKLNELVQIVQKLNNETEALRDDAKKGEKRRSIASSLDHKALLADSDLRGASTFSLLDRRAPPADSDSKGSSTFSLPPPPQQRKTSDLGHNSNCLA